MPSQNRHVLWAPRAKRDLLDIWRYFARVGSPEVADKLLVEVGQAVRRASDRPLSGRARDELRQGLRSILIHPFTVFYRVENGDLQIVRVLHERRDFRKLFAKTKRERSDQAP